MAGSLTTAIIAVSVTVMSPMAPATAPPRWSGMPGATLGAIVQDWAARAGQPSPVVDPAVAAYRIGAVKVVAADYCAATARLVASLGHAATRPALMACGSTAAPLVIAASEAGDGGQAAR
jgi:hypothetical protein